MPLTTQRIPGAATTRPTVLAPHAPPSRGRRRREGRGEEPWLLATPRPHLATPRALPSSDGPAATAPALLPTSTTPLGRITIRRITPADAGGAAVLVARAFAAAGSAPLGDVSAFITRCLAQDGAEDAPTGLVADLTAAEEEEPPSSSSSPFPFPPGRSSAVVGFAAVAGPGRAAVDRAASDGGASPSHLPPGAAVLTNVAVDPRARRCGIGKLLVAGAEEVARAEGASGLWLEPRPGPGGAAARALYAACGYEEAVEGLEGAEELSLGGLLGRLARATKRTPELLVKKL